VIAGVRWDYPSRVSLADIHVYPRSLQPGANGPIAITSGSLPVIALIPEMYCAGHSPKSAGLARESVLALYCRTGVYCRVRALIDADPVDHP
jgi:hypothetical protein